MELSKVGLGGGLPRKCIHVHQNGEFEHGRVLYVQPEWDMDALLNAVSNRLEIVPSARRLFNSDGIEIEDVLMIEDGAIVFVSSGTDFIVPAWDKHLEAGEGGSGQGGRGSGDGQPNHAGQGQGQRGAAKGGSHMPPVVGGYIVGDLLGKGGFGEVRLGTHQLTQERVAMKFMHKSAIIASMGAAERATTEIQCLMALNHPNVIRLVQQFETPKYMVMAFELMEGGDLFGYLTSLPHSAMSEDEARNVFHQIVSAVSYAHNHHICHRDLKLENVLLAKEGSLQVKIADFGLSDFYPPGATRRSHCGSFAYLAPEVFKGTSNAGPPIDVWALGVMLFAMLCGRLPFDANAGKLGKGGKKKQAVPQSEYDEEMIIRQRILKCQFKIDEGLSPEAKDLVRRMLKLDPGERASIPEITTHFWLRMRHSTMFDVSSNGRHAPSPSSVSDSPIPSPLDSPSPLTIKSLSTTGGARGLGGLTTSVSAPLLPPTSPVGRSAPRLSPAPLPSPVPFDTANVAAVFGMSPPPDNSPAGPSLSTSPNLLRPSPLLPDSNGLSHNFRPAGITPLSLTGRLREMGGQGGGQGSTPMTIMFDAPLLTSPLHAKRKEGKDALLSFLDAPPDAKDDGTGAYGNDMKVTSPLAGLGKSGLTGKAQSMGRLIDINAAPERTDYKSSPLSPSGTRGKSISGPTMAVSAQISLTSKGGSTRGGGPMASSSRHTPGKPSLSVQSPEAKDGSFYPDAGSPSSGGMSGEDGERSHYNRALGPTGAVSPHGRGAPPTAAGLSGKGDGTHPDGFRTGDKKHGGLGKLEIDHSALAKGVGGDGPDPLLLDGELGGGGKRLVPLAGGGTPTARRKGRDA